VESILKKNKDMEEWRLFGREKRPAGGWKGG
jgi:hypothetical protein